MGWASTEFETIDLGDARRNKRAIRLVEHLSAQPLASVPQACGDWADTMAAYRLFNNEVVDWRAILSAHTDCAKTRMAGHEVVLCIQDTTERDFNGQQASGLGPLSYEAQRGMYVHPTYAVSRRWTGCCAHNLSAGDKLWSQVMAYELLIDGYRSRWEIEMFFHVLKNGCRIEALQLVSSEKIKRALLLYVIVAWRIARLMRLRRSCPDLDAQLMFEPDEWKAAFILNQKRPPNTPPTLNEIVRLVARLGGFLARTGDGEPGVKTIWLGMQRILDFAAGVRFSRELQAAGSCV